MTRSKRQRTAREVHALSKGLEGVLRRLLGPLIGSVGLHHIEEMVRTVFVEEAEKHLREQYGSRSVPESQLSLVTGVGVPELNAIRKQSQSRNNGENPEANSHLMPLSRLVDRWTSDPEYFDQDSGESKQLPLLGPSPSIEALMDLAGFDPDVTPQSVLNRLRMSGVVRQVDDLTVCLEAELIIPNDPEATEGVIEAGYNAIQLLHDTLMNNLEELDEGEARHYQRVFWTPRIPAEHLDRLRGELHALMEDFQTEATEVMMELEMKVESPGQSVAGFGLYYFEEPGLKGL